MASMPFRMILYVFRGSLAVNGGAPVMSSLIEETQFIRPWVIDCHLPYKHSKCPVIHGFVVAFIQDDFRCNIFCRN